METTGQQVKKRFYRFSETRRGEGGQREPELFAQSCGVRGRRWDVRDPLGSLCLCFQTLLPISGCPWSF